MGPLIHLAGGAVMGGALWAATGDTDVALWCSLGNVLSDTDHLLEYGLYCLTRRQKPRLREFMSGEYFAEKGTLAVLFHGHEHLLALTIASIFLWRHQNSAAPCLAAFTAGYAAHMLLDLIGNDCGFKGYSILYRAFVKFDERRICGQDKMPKNKFRDKWRRKYSERKN